MLVLFVVKTDGGIRGVGLSRGVGNVYKAQVGGDHGLRHGKRAMMYKRCERKVAWSGSAGGSSDRFMAAGGDSA